MVNALFLFASEAEPHISLKAEEIFEIGGIEVTNSMLYGVLVAISTLVLAALAARKVGLKPRGGLTQIFEMFMEFMLGMLEQVFGERRKAVKYAPIFSVFFLFIVMSNVSGLLPVVGEGVRVGSSPLLRPFTADLNGTLAMSIIAILFVQYYSIKESGLLGHLKHYFTDQPLNPINLFIGLLEVFGELTRVVSLSLRLFLNTAVGEILVAVFAFVGQKGSSFTILPIVLFEVLVALIQAYVFTVLAATYLSLAISHGHEDHADEPHAEPELQPGASEA